ncbi:hypothetical protein HU761_22745 [Pseudomonas sp. SWRI59]|uniref:hypothetical protein n=1 Tax=unclassified Pseudomonas TaxID=196821 RepID=UPI00164931F1|nr:MULTISPECIES: hypothetical protein [unclassified Pseudomonas]MBC3504207.1 hypothetical protein [Pseudomonas sp. SWRI59]MBC3509521.1 hypothetical protein [Pseudomonas sp. SWRI68]
MTWELSNPAKQRELEVKFKSHGISFENVGFCDDPNFIKQERKDSRYLELYAQYVEVKSYTPEYLEEARRRIDIAAEVLRAEVERDGRMGACVDTSGMLGRMLDRLGVWNYVAKSCLTINFPSGSGETARYFWTFDVGEFAAPHAIVIAPPYCIVDLTVKQQPYNPRQSSMLPSIVLEDSFTRDTWLPEDLANHGLLSELRRRQIPFDKFLKQQNPGMASVIQHLPPRISEFKGAHLKYVIVAVGGFIEPLEGIEGYKPNGRLAHSIFESDVLPLIGKEGFA